jgi:hypothetical protein
MLEMLARMVQGVSGMNGKATNGKAKSPHLGAFVAKDARTGQPVLQFPMPSPEVLQRGVIALQNVLAGLVGPTRN